MTEEAKTTMWGNILKALGWLWGAWQSLPDSTKEKVVDAVASTFKDALMRFAKAAREEDKAAESTEIKEAANA